MTDFFATHKQAYSKAVRAALFRTATDTVKQARQNLVAAVPKAGRKSPRYGDSLTDAIRWYYNKGASTAEYTEVKLHAMGDRSKSSGTFRTRFFESGTAERDHGVKVGRKGKTRSSGNASHRTGRITPKNFFASALAKNEKLWQTNIDRYLSKATDKLNNNE